MSGLSAAQNGSVRMPLALPRISLALLSAAVLLAATCLVAVTRATPAHAAAAQTYSYWAPWYDNASPGMLQDNVHILNPDPSTAADVTVKLPGLGDLTATVPPKGERFLSWPFRTAIGGPLQVTASLPVIVSQRVTYGYSFNEYPVQAQSAAGRSFWFPWFDLGTPGFVIDNIHVVNPGSQPAIVTFQLGSNTFSYHFTVAGGTADYYHFPSGFMTGPIHVTSDQPVVVSQRVTYNQSFNEIPGVPDSAAANFTVFNWYDWDSPGFNSSWIHVTNPGAQAANVSVSLAGVSRLSFGVDPGRDRYFAFPGEINGPLLLTSDHPVIATQRVDYWGSFKEYPGLTAAATSAWFNWYDNASPCFVQNNIHVYSQGHAFGTITIGDPASAMPFDVRGEGWFAFPLGTIGGPIHVIGDTGSDPFYAESRTVRCPPPPPPPPPPPVPMPVTLRVPALGIYAAVESVGEDSSGNMGTPARSSDTAWFNLVPRPGDGGDSVITGHVNWYDNPCAVFCNLPAVRVGMDVYVDRADGSTIHFAVDNYNYYDAAGAPPDWLYTTQGGPQLTLITCGGDFDPSSGHYNKRLLVHTHSV